jgi:hypothetical protein
MTEDIFARVLSAFMEAVHVELSDERVDVAMSEVLGQDLILEVLDLFDGELSTVSHPMYDRLVVFVV